MAPEHKPSAAIAWKIRAFRATDAPAIAEILRDSAEAAQWPPESYAKLAESPGGVVLVSEASGQPVGFLAARQAADEAEILNIAVQRDFRRKGVASALLLAASPPSLYTTATASPPPGVARPITITRPKTPSAC